MARHVSTPSALQQMGPRSDNSKVEGDERMAGLGGMAAAGAAFVALGGPWLAIAVEIGGPRGPLFLSSVAVLALGVGMLLLRLAIAVPPVEAQLRRVEASWTSPVGPGRASVADGRDHHTPATPTTTPG
jgi:hypothetical protein